MACGRRLIAPSVTFAARLSRLSTFGNLGGGLLTFVYFRFLDPSAVVAGTPVGLDEVAFFLVAFSLLFMAVRALARSWLAPVTQAIDAGVALADVARRRALWMPAFIASTSGAGWVAAGVLWGVVWPLLDGQFSAARAARQLFGITFVAGPFVTAIVFFGAERLLRAELPRLFPKGDLGAAGVPPLRVRTRLLAVFLLACMLPLAVLSAAALTRANALLTASADEAVDIVHHLNLVVGVLAAGGLLVSVWLAFLVASSISQPLRDLQRAMREVRQGRLDVRCAVVSNDEIGAAAEGFNEMVQGLREREAIRETFGKYVSPEVRDEILAGRAAVAGAQHDVTILFADLRDFTPWVEATPPAEVVADLNAYFGEMDAAIRAHGGLVLQFIGDEIEAVFGAPLDDPRHADRALAAAREMRTRLDAWNAARRAAGRRELHHGIGLHSGTVVAGNIGSSERMSYALVGDAVNLASRIQALNKTLGTHTLVSGATHARLVDTTGLVPMPTVRVKGRSAEVEVYALH